MGLNRRAAFVLSSAVFLVVTTPARLHGAPYFTGGYRAFPAQPASMSARVGDFNEDGYLDVVSGSSSSAYVSVLLGNGGGALLPATSIAVGSQPRSVAVADLNGDGHLDFATANAGSGTVSIRLGNSNGTFYSAPDVAAGTMPWVVVASDLDRDGDVDLAVLDATAGTIQTILNNAGVFGPVSFTRATFPRPRDLAIADLDGDLYPDAAVGTMGDPQNGGGARTTGFHGNGNGSFGNTFPIHPTITTSVGIADLDVDGKNDVIANGKSVYFGNGNGTFAPQVAITTDLVESVAFGDIDGDAIPDVIAAASTDGVWLVRGLGARTFAPGASYGVGCDPRSAAVADLNGDGRLDVITAAGAIAATLLNRNGSLGTTFHDDGPLGAVAAGDLNHDGNADLVYSDRYGRSVAVHLGHGDGTFGPRADFDVGSYPGAIRIADLKEDGHPDLVVTNPNTDNTISVLPGLGDGTFGPRLDTTTSTWPYDLLIRDFGGDGHLDVAVGCDGAVNILKGAGDGTFSERRDVALSGNYESIDAGDFDGDGDLDLASSINTPGTANVRTWINSGNGLDFGVTTIYSGSILSQAEDLVVGDLDGNGTLDIVTASIGGFGNNHCDGYSTMLVFGGLGNGTFVQQPTLQVPATAGSLAIADLDGDGKSDLLEVSGMSGAVVFLGNGTLEGGPRYPFGAGTWPLEHAIADFNNDGAPDLAVMDLIGHSISILMNQSALVSVEQAPGPATLRLGPAFPNPAAALVRIPFSLPVSTRARVRILDAQGRALRTLLDGETSAGPHALHWDCANAAGRRVAPGVYFYELLANGVKRSGRVVVVE